MLAFDLFAGAGGASLGLHRAGLEVVAFEWWDRACETHRAALPDMPVLQVDLAAIAWRHPLLAYGRPRFMWASPPCQPFSAAGAHAGEDDGRDGIPHWLRALDEVRPDVAVMENVPGLTFAKHSDYLARMLDSVRQIGYELAWRLLDAADYGVPQNRQRFILLARRDGGPLAWPAASHCEHGGLFTERWVTMAEALGWGFDDQPARAVCGNRTPRWLYEDADGTHGKVVVGHDVTNHLTGPDDDRTPYTRDVDRPAPVVDCRAAREWKLHTNRDQRPDGSRQIVECSRPAPALSTKAVGQWKIESGEWADERPATTITTDGRVFGPHSGSAGEPQSSHAIRIEVWQAGVLQGFPPDYPWQGNRTEQSTQVGNAAPPPLVEAIARALFPEGTR